MPFTAEIARRAVALSYEDIPADVADICRQCLLDWFGVTLAGSQEDATRLVLEELTPPGPVNAASGATVVGHAGRLPMHDAALVNGTASHALDYDDVNESMFGHPSVPILAGLLPLADVTRASGRDLLCAFASGYESECRIGRALGPEHYQRGFHTTATAGTFGAALACARLLRVDAATAETAIGIAATQAAGLKSMFGTMCKPLHAGRAGAAGLLAARLAARGFTAAPASLETTQGFGETHTASFDAVRGLADPPSGWYLRSNLFKYHAACYQTHSSIEGLRRLRESERFRPDDVEAVTIHADGAQMRMCAIPDPSTGLQVKFSLRHTAALALSGVDTSAIGTFTDAVAADPDLVALRDRVTVTADRPGGGPTPVEVRLRDGRVLAASHDVSEPEKDLSLQGARLRQKFDALATPVIGAAGAGRLAALVAAVDDAGDVADLLAAARP